MCAQERKSGFINPRLDSAIRVHADLLMKIQEVRFDVGLDEYRRRTPWEQIEAAAKEKQQIQKACYEAYAAAGEVLKRLAAERAHDGKTPPGLDSGRTIN